MNSLENPILPTENLHINIKYALSVTHDHSWYEVKTKSEYAIFVIQDGIVNIEYDKVQYTLHPGDVFLFYPQILYQATTPSESCSFIFIHFDAILGHNHQALHFYPFDGHYVGSQLTLELDCILSGFSSLQKKEPFSEMYLNGSLMHFLASAMKLKYESNEATAISPGKSTLSRLQPALIYIGEHISEPVYIRDLADCVNLSEKYFITYFKRVVGITPTNYIIQAKMKKALEYLHEHKYSVKEVAAFVGYSDIYTFSKVFKKTYGISPSKI